VGKRYAYAVWRIILKQILNMGERGQDGSGSGYGSVAVSVKCINEASASIKSREFIG
jgi:hypothetical protein